MVEKELYDLDTKIKIALGQVHAELNDAYSKFAPFNSPHEGYAIIKEEFDELWEAVRCKGFSKKDRHNEAKQTAAMAIRFMVDLGE